MNEMIKIDPTEVLEKRLAAGMGLDKYSKIMEMVKSVDVSNVEASFPSKMYATIYPEKPIWDRYVVQNLGIRVSEVDKEEKIKISILVC